ncbi:protein-tyrosine phosphatase family protein [Actinokineospora sp.]|uniref:protein-tyrosine phosphatase family protein n=1 Tax=Actinokineospora sp. TaxID=1872133 RepID=UPI004037F60F
MKNLTGAIRLPDGTWVRGRGLRDPLPPGDVPDRGLYLGTRKLRDRHESTLRWPHDWVAWPDFLLPRDRDGAVRQIRALHDDACAGRRVEVACGAGIGRTGTVIACLAVLSRLSTSDAIEWTRANYHHKAVETPWQRGWVARFPAK